MAVSAVIGAPITGAPVCLATVPISEIWSKCACETKIPSALVTSLAAKPMAWLRGVRSKSVLRAMGAVRREEFLPPDLYEFAYEGSPLPIAGG